MERRGRIAFRSDTKSVHLAVFTSVPFFRGSDVCDRTGVAKVRFAIQQNVDVNVFAQMPNFNCHRVSLAIVQCSRRAACQFLPEVVAFRNLPKTAEFTPSSAQNNAHLLLPHWKHRDHVVVAGRTSELNLVAVIALWIRGNTKDRAALPDWDGKFVARPGPLTHDRVFRGINE